MTLVAGIAVSCLAVEAGPGSIQEKRPEAPKGEVKKGAQAKAQPKAQPKAEYVGAKKCRKCHRDENKSWKDTKHAGTWDLLAEKYRNDDSKDEGGKACVSCHITGYGQPGGPATAKEGIERGLEGTQCEACHGPGGAHLEPGKALTKIKGKAKKNPGEEKAARKKVEETINKVPRNTCIRCHNPHVTHEKYAQGKKPGKK